MASSAHYKHSMIALLFWAIGLFFFLGVWQWSYSVAQKDAENRLLSEAGRLASQLARVLALPETKMDERTILAILSRAMDDESVYAVKAENADGEAIGWRRNYLWETSPWDDEIADDCVQGSNVLKYRGEIVGKIEVWISARQTREELAIHGNREAWKLFYSCFLWTCAFIFLFWIKGDFRRLASYMREAGGEDEDEAPKRNRRQGEADTDLVSPSRGRAYQREDNDAWYVTAGMFRQTFGRAPRLISRLYAEGETAGLCHLGRILEQAAPCIGSIKLEKAAKDMQNALNNPENESTARPVEECARTLERALEALAGENRRPVSAESGEASETQR
ncbi:MAG: hypothetical protein HDQ93_04010 [Desulfovibrio sp.]|nr:hypothetical protein [Desulfovibrio sp.]